MNYTKIKILILFIVSLSFGVFGYANYTQAATFADCPTTYGTLVCGAGEQYCGACVTGIADNRSPDWTLNCGTCTWSCPAPSVACGGTCGPAYSGQNPTCVAKKVTTDQCGNCTNTCSTPGDTYCSTSSSCITPTACGAGATWNGCNCVANPYILANPSSPQSAYMDITGKGVFGDDIFMTSGKAIRVDGNFVTTNLYMGNWGDGPNGFNLFVGGRLVGSQEIVAADLTASNSVNAFQLNAPYWNSNGDPQIRIDADNNGDNFFNVRNGTNDVIFQMDETGHLSVYDGISMGNKVINGLADPIDPDDAATKAYVDAQAGGGGGYWVATGNEIINNNLGNVIVSGDLLLKYKTGSVKGDITIQTGGGGTGGHNGSDLHVHAGNGIFAGSTDRPGGDLYLFGGAEDTDSGSGVLNGDVILAYTGSTARGKVGIGTATPNALLHVYKTSGNNAEIDIQSVVGVDNHWAIYQDRTTQDLKFWNNNGAGDYNALTISDGGNLTVQKNMTDYGTAFTSPHLRLQAANNLDSTGFVGIAYEASTSDNYGWSSGALRSSAGQSNFVWKYHNNTAVGSEYMRITKDGIVGIGTVAPAANVKLDINGGVKIGASNGDAAGTISYSANDFWGFDGTDWKSLTSGGSGGGPWTQTGSNIYPTTLTSQVAIGTSNASVYSLMVNNTTNGWPVLFKSTTSNGSNVLIRVSSSQPSADPRLSFGDDNPVPNALGRNWWNMGVDNSDADKFKISTDFNSQLHLSTKLTMDTSGNLGLGTSNPSSKLDVVGGNIRTTGSLSASSVLSNAFYGSTGDPDEMISIGDAEDIITIGGKIKINEGTPGAGKVLTSDATGLASWQTPATGGALPVGTSGQTLRHNGSSWVNNSLIYNNGSNVGIGTTAPGRRLAVVGDPATLHTSAIGVYDGSTLVVDLQAKNTVYGPIIQFTTGAGGFDMLNFRFIGADGPYNYKWTTKGSTNTSVDRFLISGNAAIANISMVNSNVIIGAGLPSLGVKLHVVGNIKTTGSLLANSLYGGTGVGSEAISIGDAADIITIGGKIKINEGTPGVGKVLTSDATGLASWQTPATGGALPVGTSGQTLRYNGSSWVNNSLIYNNGIDIGIGTSSLGSGKRLTIEGNGLVRGDWEVRSITVNSGADLAEEFIVDKNLETGTVVVFGDYNLGYKSVKPSYIKYDTSVVGVVSDNPAVIMGKIDADNKAVIAMTGVVHVKVTNINGAIKRGDLLTTSNISGHAMKATDLQVGTIIGKAMEDLNSSQGEIMALINLQ